MNEVYNLIVNITGVANHDFRGVVRTVTPVLHIISRFMGFVGVLVLVWGVLVSTKILAVMEFNQILGKQITEQRARLRVTLGFYLLLGLEFLVASDIIETIAAPSLKAVAVLGSIVAIRTIISFTLNWEIVQELKQDAYNKDGSLKS